MSATDGANGPVLDEEGDTTLIGTTPGAASGGGGASEGDKVLTDDTRRAAAGSLIGGGPRGADGKTGNPNELADEEKERYLSFLESVQSIHKAYNIMRNSLNTMFADTTKDELAQLAQPPTMYTFSATYPQEHKGAPIDLVLQELKALIDHYERQVTSRQMGMKAKRDEAVQTATKMKALYIRDVSFALQMTEEQERELTEQVDVILAGIL